MDWRVVWYVVEDSREDKIIRQFVYGSVTVNMIPNNKMKNWGTYGAA